MTVTTLAEAPPRTGLATGAAAITVVLWASSFVAIRHVGTEISAGALSLARLGLGSIFLGALLFTRPRPAATVRRWPARRDWLPLIACGVLWFGVYNLTLNEAERRLDAGTSAMLVHIAPLLIAVLAGLGLGEGFPRQLVIGSLVAFAGIVVIGTSTSSGRAETWGVVLCIIAAISYAVGVVTQKPLLSRLPAAEVTWLACTIGAVVCLPFAPTLVEELRTADAATIWWVVYLAAFPTALGFTTWAFALRRTSAGRMGVTVYAVPVIAIALGWLFLGETPAVLALAGGALCLIGVAISRRTA
ncbi:threonine/homoserine efflux transporter RhtA [Kribbella kalugense]|uniref:Threonine/homoserine efflux transporter RhtA n=1 Tax=Kribbella kalugense TaxID=2512221 RepID=A0A4R7ZKB5_9ACTN|nr:threonine/homoserine efflux transporter RhtA [Kribbella kalugense]